MDGTYICWRHTKSHIHIHINHMGLGNECNLFLGLPKIGMKPTQVPPASWHGVAWPCLVALSTLSRLSPLFLPLLYDSFINTFLLHTIIIYFFLNFFSYWKYLSHLRLCWPSSVPIIITPAPLQVQGQCPFLLFSTPHCLTVSSDFDVLLSQICAIK